MKTDRFTGLRPTRYGSESFEALDQERIRVRAYQLYEQRGREDGHDLQDWFKAESELIGKAKAGAA